MELTIIIISIISVFIILSVYQYYQHQAIILLHDLTKEVLGLLNQNKVTEQSTDQQGNPLPSNQNPNPSNPIGYRIPKPQQKQENIDTITTSTYTKYTWDQGHNNHYHPNKTNQYHHSTHLTL